MKRSESSVKTPLEEELRWYYQIGEEAVRGASTAELVAKYKLAKYKLTGDYARKAKQFAEQFSPDDLESCFPVSPNAGKKLPWGHIRALVGVPDPVIRLELVKRAVANSWPRNQLEKEIEIAKGKEPGRRLGRHATPPQSLEQALLELRSRSEQWLEYWEVSKEALDLLTNETYLKILSDPKPANKEPRCRLSVQKMQSTRAVFQAHRNALSHPLTILAQLDPEYFAAVRAKSRPKRS